MNDHQNLEGRLRNALRAQGDRVSPDEGAGLDTIRHRGARARTRRRAALAGAGMALTLVAALLVVPRLGDDDPSRVDVVPADQSPTTAPPEPASTTTEIHGRDSVAPVDVVWPPPDREPFADPLDAARSFVEDYVGIDDPPLSAVRETAPGSAEVDVFRRGENGAALDIVASVVSLEELDDGTWAVAEARSEAIVVDGMEGAPGAESTVTVRGRGRGYEGTIVATLRELGMGVGESLAVEPTIAGCCETLEPFSVDLTFARSEPANFEGSVLLTTDSGLDGGVVDFTVLPFSFSTQATAPSGSLDVWFLDGEQVAAVSRPRPETSGVLRAALEALLAGPTAEERADGLDSAFGDGSEGLLADVTITDGLAVVDFDDRLRETTSGLASASSAALLEQLNRTVLQFGTVQRVEYRLGGSCDAFGAWAHDRVCETYDRSDVGVVAD